MLLSNPSQWGSTVISSADEHRSRYTGKNHRTVVKETFVAGRDIRMNRGTNESKVTGT